MKQVKKYFLIIFLLIIADSVLAQNRNIDILSDSTKLAEYVYLNMHYPLMDLLNNIEGTAVYKSELDSISGINNLNIIKSSGSSSLDREGIRLLWQVPRQGNEFPKHEISINFKLADNKIYDISEVLAELPEFPGGDAEMFKFISTNLNAPPEAADMAISGKVICGCVIEKDGSINIVEIVRPLHNSIDAEVVRVVKRMPKWKAGKKEGKPVRVYVIVPMNISFQ